VDTEEDQEIRVLVGRISVYQKIRNDEAVSPDILII